MTDKKITALLIVEMAGKPEEHLKSSLIGHVENLKNFKGITLVKYTAHEPKPLEMKEGEAKDMFSTFAEIEIESNDFSSLMDLVFDFMPSSIEIIEPSSLEFNLQDATMILNRLAGRLHRYDEIAKIASMESEQIKAQFNHIMQQLMRKKLEAEENQISEVKKEEKEEKKEEKKIEEVKEEEKEEKKFYRKKDEDDEEKIDYDEDEDEDDEDEEIEEEKI